MQRHFKRTLVLVLVGLFIVAAIAACPYTWFMGQAIFGRYPLPTREEARAVELVVETRLGSVLDTVSATPMRFDGMTDDGGIDIVGFRVVWRVRDATATVSNYTCEGEYFVLTDMLPPDDMTPQQYVQLLRAYSAVSARPIGVLGSYHEAALSESATTSTVGGREWSTDQLWVLVEGYDDLDQVRSRQQYDCPGLVFFVPEHGDAEFVGNLDEAHLLVNDIGD